MERRQVGFRLKAPFCSERNDDVAVRAFDGNAGIEGQPAVAKGRAFREHDGPPIKNTVIYTEELTTDGL